MSTWLIELLIFVLRVRCAVSDDDRWRPISEADNDELVKPCKSKTNRFFEGIKRMFTRHVVHAGMRARGLGTGHDVLHQFIKFSFLVLLMNYITNAFLNGVDYQCQEILLLVLWVPGVEVREQRIGPCR